MTREELLDLLPVIREAMDRMERAEVSGDKDKLTLTIYVKGGVDTLFDILIAQASAAEESRETASHP